MVSYQRGPIENDSNSNNCIAQYNKQHGANRSNVNNYLLTCCICKVSVHYGCYGCNPLNGEFSSLRQDNSPDFIFNINDSNINTQGITDHGLLKLKLQNENCQN